MRQRGYRWVVVLVAGVACAAIAGFATGSIFLAAIVFAVVASIAVLIESG